VGGDLALRCVSNLYTTMKKDLSEHNLEAFAELERACEQTRYGTLNVWMKLHDGQVVAIEGNQLQVLRFKENENNKAMAVVLAEAKHLSEAKRSGNVTYTLSLVDGHIREVHLQRNLTRRFPLRKGDS